MIKTDPLYWFWKSELPPLLCSAIIAEGTSRVERITPAVVGYGPDARVDETIRKSKTCFFDSTSWVAGITSHYMRMANEAAWRYDIIGPQNPQFTIYDKDEFYDYHEDQSTLPSYTPRDDDVTGVYQRKLSLVINLSDVGDYYGGEFQFEDGFEPDIQRQGSIMVFPSFLRHRVQPVVTGRRYSLVNWFIGKGFR